MEQDEQPESEREIVADLRRREAAKEHLVSRRVARSKFIQRPGGRSGRVERVRPPS